MTLGEYGEFVIKFGRYRGRARYLDHVEPFENELQWRETWGIKVEDD